MKKISTFTCEKVNFWNIGPEVFSLSRFRKRWGGFSTIFVESSSETQSCSKETSNADMKRSKRAQLKGKTPPPQKKKKQPNK